MTRRAGRPREIAVAEVFPLFDLVPDAPGPRQRAVPNIREPRPGEVLAPVPVEIPASEMRGRTRSGRRGGGRS